MLVSGFVIAFASWLSAGRQVLAGFIVALPLISILTILFAWIKHRDMTRINEFAVAIVAAVPLSMLFFVPLLFNKWLKLNFITSFSLGLGLLVAAYIIHQALLK